MDLVIVSIFGFLGLIITAVVAPYLIARQLGHQRAVEKREEWRRADELATRAEASATAIVESNERVADAATVTAEVQNKKLDVIHILSNSTLSEAKKAQLLALEQSLDVLTRLAPDDDAAIAVVRDKVDALRVEVAERARQDALAAEVAAAPLPSAE